MNPEDVTLAVPCYNAEESLPELFDALDRLSPQPRRIVCIDDGSTDGTRGLIRNHDRPELVVHEENKGLAAARNTALEITDSPGLAMLDADVIPDEGWLAAVCTALDERDAAMVGGRLVERLTTVADEWRAVHLPQQFGDEPLSREWVPGSNFLCRAEAVRSVGGWNEAYRTNYEDVDIGRRLRAAGRAVWYTPHARAEHDRTDSVRSVVSTMWDWYYKHAPPTQVAELPKRMEMHLGRTIDALSDDLRERNWRLVPITLLRPIVHGKRDVESVLRRRGE